MTTKPRLRQALLIENPEHAASVAMVLRDHKMVETLPWVAPNEPTLHLAGRSVILWPISHASAIALAHRLIEPAAVKIVRAGDAMPSEATPDAMVKFLQPRSHKWTRPARRRDAPLIRIKAGVLFELATEAETALMASGAPFYVRGGRIVRPITEEVEAAKGRKAMAARLATVTADTLLDYLSRAAKWEKYDGRSEEFRPTDPPRNVAEIVLSREGEWSFETLAGVLTTPTLRPDGSILDRPGYDPVTRLLLIDPPRMPAVPSRPTRDQAFAALAVLNSLLADFPFVNDASKSCALSALITPVVRGAMPVAPLHGMTAPEAGSGKSYLVDLASAIATGQRCPVIAAGRDETETEKRLVSALRSGQPIVSLDNVNGPLGGDFLCQMIERPVVAPRILGVSELQRIENRVTMFATGNNMVPTGDVVRRVVLCTLDPNLERPELRAFDGDPLDAILADRGRYIAAAITIVRAWVIAGRPNPLPPLASFEAWSMMVRSPLAWLGCADPVATIETARADDPAMARLRSIVAAWEQAAGRDNPVTAGELKELAEKSTPVHSATTYGRQERPRDHPEFHSALALAAGRHGEIDAFLLGHFLRKNKGRVVGEVKIVAEEDTHLKQKLWSLNAVK